MGQPVPLPPDASLEELREAAEKPQRYRRLLFALAVVLLAFAIAVLASSCTLTHRGEVDVGVDWEEVGDIMEAKIVPAAVAAVEAAANRALENPTPGGLVGAGVAGLMAAIGSLGGAEIGRRRLKNVAELAEKHIGETK